MKRNYTGMIFMDAEAGSGGGAPIVPAAASPTGAEISTVTPAAPQIVSHPTTRAEPRAISPMEILGLPKAPSKENAATAKAIRERGKENTIELPKPKKPVTPAAVKPGATPVPAATPTATPKVETPAAQPAKITLSGKEYTPAELEAHVKALQDKAEGKTPETPAAAATPAAEKTPEELKAETATRRQQWIDDKVAAFKPEDFGITEELWDDALSGGKKAMPALVQIMGKVAANSELAAREFMAQEMNQIMTGIAPALDTHQKIAVYEAEKRFVTDYPALQPNLPKIREIAAALLKNFPAECGKMSEEVFFAEVAGQFKRLQEEFLGTTTPAITPPVAAVTPAPVAAAPDPAIKNAAAELAAAARTPGATVVKPTPQPPAGQVGAVLSPVPANATKSLISQLAAREGI